MNTTQKQAHVAKVARPMVYSKELEAELFALIEKGKNILEIRDHLESAFMRENPTNENPRNTDELAAAYFGAVRDYSIAKRNQKGKRNGNA